LHVASPLPTGVPRDADELIVPARDGALRVLRAARDAGARRVVMTSSVAAIAYGHGRGRHLRALTAPGLAGERFIASGRFMKLAEIAAVLHSALGPEAACVPTRRIHDALLRVAALFSPMLRTAAGEPGSVCEHSSARAREVLAWQPRPEAETIVDAARSLLPLDRALGR
jgi:nucleoside-diphosphate-sugar epimerase